MATDVDRLLLLASRRRVHRPWLPADVAELESFVGRLTPAEMAERVGRSLNSVKCKLRTLGFKATGIRDPLGLSAIGVARRLGVPYEVIWRMVRSSQVKAKRFERGKDYLIGWPDVRRLEQHFGRMRRRRERALARISEKTITKQAFMRLIGLSETHATRYLQGGIVKAWKVPCKWSMIAADRWEWLVSLADARRVKREREHGKLRLGKRKFRQLVARESARVAELRRAGKLGRSRRQPRPCPVPGHLSPSQIAQVAGVSRETVARDIRNCRLKAKRIRVGRRQFLVVPEKDVPAYLKTLETRSLASLLWISSPKH